MSDQTIRAFYNATSIEENRLQLDVFQLEGVRTREIITRYLKGSRMNIADIGGATGAYAFWLHDLGHAVHLLDITERHIATAKETALQQNKPLASIQLGDACSLPYDNDQFDMVLLLGPLYHLPEKADRLQAIKEVHRVLKPGGIMLAAAITRYASLLDGFWRNLVSDPAFVDMLNKDLQDGRHINPTNNPDYFTTAYFHNQQELEAELTTCFLAPQIIAVEGFGWLVPDFMERWQDAAYRSQLLEYIRKTETDPVIIGMSAHWVAVAIK